MLSLDYQLASIEKRFKRAARVRDLSQRRTSLARISCDLLKLRVKYDSGSWEEEKIILRQKKYSSVIGKVEKRISDKIKRGPENPYTVVVFDDTWMIAEDQDLVLANNEILKRYYCSHPEYCLPKE